MLGPVAGEEEDGTSTSAAVPLRIPCVQNQLRKLTAMAKYQAPDAAGRPAVCALHTARRRSAFPSVWSLWVVGDVFLHWRTVGSLLGFRALRPSGFLSLYHLDAGMD